MSKYIDLISKDEKQVKKEEVEIKAKEAELQVAYDLIAAEKAVAAAQRAVNKAKQAVPFSAVELVEDMRNLADAEADVKALQAVKAELFGA